MISVTLNFKSIEAARQALLDIPETLLVGGPAAEAPAVEAPPAPKQKAPKAAPAPEAAPVQPTAQPEEVPALAAAPAEPEQEKQPAEPSVDYPTLQKAVFALAGKSRDAAAAVAASFGVKTFKELPADKWADALEAVTERLAIVEA